MSRRKAPAPEHLSPAERQIWAELLPSLSAPVRGAELLKLERLCVALARWRTASAAIRAEGAIIAAPRTGVAAVNPWASIERKAAAEASRLERALGISGGRQPKPDGALGTMFEPIGPADLEPFDMATLEPWEPPAEKTKPASKRCPPRLTR